MIIELVPFIWNRGCRLEQRMREMRPRRDGEVNISYMSELNVSADVIIKE